MIALRGVIAVRLSAIAIFCTLLFSSARLANAQSGQVTPQCAEPNLPASVVAGYTPNSFPVLSGASGDVELEIKLSAMAEYIDGSTRKVWDDASFRILVLRALIVAQKTRFQAQIFRCRPVSGVYRFRVAFRDGQVTFVTRGDLERVNPEPAAKVACSRPDSPAQLLYGDSPDTPPIAVQQGISGDVAVMITLDETSRLVSAVIQRSAHPLLNNAALSAARHSVFQTKFENCLGIAERYVFIVGFTLPPAGVGSAPDMLVPLRYFLGSWKCVSSPSKAPGASETFVIGDDPRELVLTMPNGNEFSAAPARRILRLIGQRVLFDETTAATHVYGSSSGWQQDALSFNGALSRAPASPLDGSILRAIHLNYARIDANHFTRTFEQWDGQARAWARVAQQTCSRVTPE